MFTEHLPDAADMGFSRLQIDHGARYVLTQILQREETKVHGSELNELHSVQLNGIQLVMRFRLEWNSVPCQSLSFPFAASRMRNPGRLLRGGDVAN